MARRQARTARIHARNVEQRQILEAEGYVATIGPHRLEPLLAASGAAWDPAAPPAPLPLVVSQGQQGGDGAAALLGPVSGPVRPGQHDEGGAPAGTSAPTADHHGGNGDNAALNSSVPPAGASLPAAASPPLTAGAVDDEGTPGVQSDSSELSEIEVSFQIFGVFLG